MTLSIIGAGLGRTGTLSLKVALELLLGGPCYHGVNAAERGDRWDCQIPDLSGYSAVVDIPASFYWEELAGNNPDSVILLSSRPTLDWWESSKQTIFTLWRTRDTEYSQMMRELLALHLSPTWDETTIKAAYEAHNEHVRATASNLIDWKLGDGWEPLCTGLQLPVPPIAFPHVNSRQEFQFFTGMGV